MRKLNRKRYTRLHIIRSSWNCMWTLCPWRTNCIKSSSDMREMLTEKAICPGSWPIGSEWNENLNFKLSTILVFLQQNLLPGGDICSETACYRHSFIIQFVGERRSNGNTRAATNWRTEGQKQGAWRKVTTGGSWEEGYLQMSLISELELLPQLQKWHQRCYVVRGKILTTGGVSATLPMEVTLNHNYPR
jgi:hypothetical protein